jgi:hypothetical protein
MIKKMIVETYSGRITAEQQKALETLFGSRGIQAATIFHAVGHRLGEKRPISTVVLLQLIKGFLESIRSEYPLKIHHSIAERTLIALKVDASQEHVEALAAEICSKLCTLGSRIFLPQALLEAAKRIDMLAIEKGAPPSEFSINEGEFHADLCNSKRGVFTPLEELQFLLDKTGENGRALSKKSKLTPKREKPLNTGLFSRLLANKVFSTLKHSSDLELASGKMLLNKGLRLTENILPFLRKKRSTL